MQSNRRFTGGFRPEDLDDSSLRHAADAERHIQRDRAGMHRLHGHVRVFAELHDGTGAEIALDLAHRGFQCACSVLFGGFR